MRKLSNLFLTLVVTGAAALFAETQTPGDFTSRITWQTLRQFAFSNAEDVKKPVRGNFDLEHLKRIHRCIFQDVYPWAGEIRTVDISKGFRFCHAAYIEKEARRLFSRLHERIEKGVRDTGEAVELAAHALSEINAIHPFRDGNGRAQREFVREMLLKLGFTVEYSRADPSLMLKASIALFMGDEGPMRGLFRACTFKNTGSNRK